MRSKLVLTGFVVSLLAIVFFALSTFLLYSQYEFAGAIRSWTVCVLAVPICDYFWETFQHIKHPGPLPPDPVFSDFGEEDQFSWYPTQKGGD